MGPVRTRRHQRHERLEKSVALGGRPVVHSVRHVRDHKGEVDHWVEIRERLNIEALHRIEPDAFKTDRRIMLSHVLPGKTRTIGPARARVAVETGAGKVLGIDAPRFSSGGKLLRQIVGRSRKGEVAVVRDTLVRAGERIEIIGLGRMRHSVKVRQVHIGRGKAGKIGRRDWCDVGRFPVLEPNPDDVLNAAD